MSRIAPKKVQDPTNLDESYDKTINQVILYLNHLVGDKKVLVVGGKHVGKTRLINSLYLALTQTDTELMSPSTKNFSISSKSLYKRGPKASKKPTNLLFYDTTGLESCDDQNKLATILRFILEGKIGEKEFRWSLMQDETSIRAKHKIQETSPERVFKAVIFVENDYNDGDAVTIADTLTKAIKRSDNNLVKKIPVLRILVDSHHEYITKNNQCSMSKDEKLSKKHDFGLCKTRINIQPYVWTDAFTEYDLDYDHDNPKGYLQVQKELLMEFEYRKKLKEQGQLTSDLDMEMGLSRDQSKHLNGPGKKNLKFEGPVNMTDSGLLNGQLDSVELIKRQNKLKRDDYFDKTFENFIVDQNNNDSCSYFCKKFEISRVHCREVLYDGDYRGSKEAPVGKKETHKRTQVQICIFYLRRGHQVGLRVG